MNLIERCLHEKTREQQRFSILEVEADWHEQVVPRHIMQPSIARDSRQLDPQYSTTDIPPSQSAAQGLHPIAHKLLLISRPVRMARWVGVGTQQPRAGFKPATSQSQVRHRTTRPQCTLKHASTMLFSLLRARLQIKQLYLPAVS